MSACRTGSHDVPIGQKLPGFGVVVLIGLLLLKNALLVQLQKKVLRRLVVIFRRGTAVDIEGDAEFLERSLHHIVVAVHDRPRLHSFLSRTHGDGHTVFVRTANKADILPHLAEKTNVDIRRKITARYVPDVHGAVGVGQCCRDQMTLAHEWIGMNAKGKWTMQEAEDWPQEFSETIERLPGLWIMHTDNGCFSPSRSRSGS
ncbi:MAG: Uncharacterised protein [Flavobacteriia bacterium]|nr:MAG: Uncharacterised protein [Flavobacteriia bacterium]